MKNHCMYKTKRNEKHLDFFGSVIFNFKVNCKVFFIKIYAV